MSALSRVYYTSAEYLERELQSEFKSEYLSGEIWMMSGATPRHNAIAFNLGSVLGSALRGGSCRGFSSDQRVIVEATGLRTYLDLTVVCGETEFHPDDKDGLVNPAALFEVLSPTTELFDRGLKWVNYQRIASLTAYILVSQKEPRVEQFVRQSDGGAWLYSQASGLDDVLSLPSLDCALPLREIYDRVAFDFSPLPQENFR